MNISHAVKTDRLPKLRARYERPPAPRTGAAQRTISDGVGSADELLSAGVETGTEGAGTQRREEALRTGAQGLSTADGDRGVGSAGAAAVTRTLGESGSVRLATGSGTPPP